MNDNEKNDNVKSKKKKKRKKKKESYVSAVLISVVYFLLAFATAGYNVWSVAEPFYPETIIDREPTAECSLQFDFDKALQNIYVANHKIGLPEAVKDLPENLTFDKTSAETQDIQTGEVLYVTDFFSYNAVPTGVIRVSGTKKTYTEPDQKVLGYFFTYFQGDEKSMLGQGIYGFRINRAVTDEQLIAFFGEPTERNDDFPTNDHKGHLLVYEYKDVEGSYADTQKPRYLMFVIDDEEGVLANISIWNYRE